MSRRKRNWDGYKNIIGTCSNPDCKFYSQLEAHHIIPLYCDGEDKFGNIIVLCHDCHCNNNLHGGWENNYKKLHNWKHKIDSLYINKLNQYYKKYGKNIDLLDINQPYTKYNISKPKAKNIKKPEEKCFPYRKNEYQENQGILPAAGIITVKDLAEYLMLNSCKLYKMLKNKGIPMLKLSNKFDQRLVRLEDLRINSE